ncbi:IMPACT family protein [Bifidobacterium aemilianum]|uniref:IMPACT family protein n=1 Tax=Bifidobacterium aemilianum TaxID=2493120 RepID=A0A366K8H9_9BIFI|nr:YigZ family protein [Bifidobacterium aemilianum]RBP97627.1 IMPACT family protein [Bifidobacterium aemilianum]
MMTILDTPDQPAHASLVEKKSDFIGDACHVESLTQAMEAVEAIRARHPKARHTAYAAICGESKGSSSERMSDDGEPSGTAGKPILDLIRAKNLTDCLVTVTRYFGGILLGSGGLIRAYASGASLALKAAQLASIQHFQSYAVPLEYHQLGSFQHILAGLGGRQTGQSYSDKVVLEVLVPLESSDRFASQVQEAFSAQVSLHALGQVSMPVR